MRVSGWCSGPDGCTSPRAHNTCQTRITNGQLDRCECTQHGGHTPKEAD